MAPRAAHPLSPSHRARTRHPALPQGSAKPRARAPDWARTLGLGTVYGRGIRSVCGFHSPCSQFRGCSSHSTRCLDPHRRNRRPMHSCKSRHMMTPAVGAKSLGKLHHRHRWTQRSTEASRGGEAGASSSQTAEGLVRAPEGAPQVPRRKSGDNLFSDGGEVLQYHDIIPIPAWRSTWQKPKPQRHRFSQDSVWNRY